MIILLKHINLFNFFLRKNLLIFAKDYEIDFIVPVND